MQIIFRSLVVSLLVFVAASGALAQAQDTALAAAAATSARLCSRGANDAAACTADSDCPGGACVEAHGVCDGGSSDGNLCDCNGGTCSTRPACTTTRGAGTCTDGALAGHCCDVHSNCRGGVPCVGTQRLCLSGQSAGSPCLNDEQCLDGMCDSTGKVCRGGSADGFTCNDDSHCPDGHCTVPVANSPTPAVPRTSVPKTPTPPPPCINPAVPTPRPAKAQFICAGGNANGQVCTNNTNCRHGQCVIGLGVCLGGANDGNPCDCPSGSCLVGQCSADPTLGKCRGGPAGSGAALCCDPSLTCGDAPCMPTHQTCVAGTRKRMPCLNDAQCPGSVCVSTGQFCEGGTADAISCASDADCPGGHCPLLSSAEAPECTPKPTPTETSTRVPTATRNTSPAKTATAGSRPTSKGSQGSSGGSSSGCAMDQSATANPLVVVAMLLLLGKQVVAKSERRATNDKPSA